VSLSVVVTRNCNLSEVEDREAGWLVESNVDSVFAGLNEASHPPKSGARGANAVDSSRRTTPGTGLPERASGYIVRISPEPTDCPPSDSVTVIILTHNEVVNIVSV